MTTKRHGCTARSPWLGDRLPTQLFAAQYDELKAEVRRLKVELDPQSFGQHPRVKLLAAVIAGIKEQIALDPYASRFSLSGPLRRYGRRKVLGLPDRVGAEAAFKHRVDIAWHHAHTMRVVTT